MAGQAVGVILAILVVIADAGAEGAVWDSILVAGQAGRASAACQAREMTRLAQLH